MAQAAGFAIQHDVREVLGRLAAERAGVRIGHGHSLATDGLGDATVAVAEARNGRATRTIDDPRAVREVQIDAVTADSGGWSAAGAVKNTTGHVRHLAEAMAGEQAPAISPGSGQAVQTSGVPDAY